MRAIHVRLRSRLGALLTRMLLPNHSGDPQARHSLLYPEPHEPPSERLLDLAIASIQNARSEDLSSISARMQRPPRWPDIWPGEHYRLLAGLVKALGPRVVIEIGTYRGLSALTLAKNLPADGVLHTFDIAPWEEVGEQVLTRADLDAGRIRFGIADFSDEATFEAHRDLFETADLLFVDAAKDGRFERRLLERLETVRFRSAPIVVFDDVRLWNMIAIWRSVRRPKLDLVSFGHWTGTGLIDWQPTEPRGVIDLKGASA